jgi:hypothetical protein
MEGLAASLQSSQIVMLLLLLYCIVRAGAPASSRGCEQLAAELLHARHIRHRRGSMEGLAATLRLCHAATAQEAVRPATINVTPAGTGSI